MNKATKKAAMELLKTKLRDLNWDSRSSILRARGCRALNTLTEYFQKHGTDGRGNYEPTVYSFLKLAKSNADVGKPLDIIGYGPELYERTCEVFAKVGVNLPKMKSYSGEGIIFDDKYHGGKA